MVINWDEGIIVRQKISLTCKWRIKLFSWILVVLTFSLKNTSDDTLSSLSVLKYSKWRIEWLSFGTIKTVWPVYAVQDIFLHFILLQCVCVCVFGFNVAFNNFSVISRRCLVVTGSSMLTFIVLPHWSIMSQTLDMIPYPVTLSWRWVDQS